MKSSRAWLLLVVAELVAVMICCALIGVLAATGNWLSAPPDPLAEVTPTSAATLPPVPTRLPTRTPAPTSTGVLSSPLPVATAGPPTDVTWTPTRAPVTYDVFVPTPTAPPLKYPITFGSNLKIVAYLVGGQTVKDLEDSLNSQALVDPNEPFGRYYALTQYYLSAKWFVQPTAAGCEVDSGSVTLAMTMTLPALTSPAAMSPDVLDRWTSFISNTIMHESGHVKRDLQGARDYQRDLGNFPPAEDCTTIKSKLSNLFDRSSNAIRQSNINYDDATQHGATQGAVFP